MEDSCKPLSSRTNSPKKEFISENKDNDSAESSPSNRSSSPEANCPICLGKPENKSFTDSCLHQFCFTCLLEWSRVKAECPLCKQSFKSIIHNVRSIEDYEQYYLGTSSAEGRLLGFIARYEPSQPREPFRYRTTAVSSYLDYYVRLEEAIAHQVIPSVPTHSSSTHWHRRRQNGTSDFRRNIYQQGLWVQRTRDITGRTRESSPEFYRSNPAQVHRLVPWLNRELNVLCSSNDPHVQHVISRILELISQIPIRSPAFTAAVAPYIGRHTDHFVHEFHSFATSPFDLIGYDRHANYVDQYSLAHDILTEPDDGEDSDVQIVGSFTPTSPLHSIHLDSDSDSDEVIVVDSVPPRQLSPEVITLESEDDDVVQVSIQIDTDTNRPGSSNQPRPSRRPPLKRNWLTINKTLQMPTSNSENVNVSINIAHASRSQSSSTEGISSSSSWSPSKRKSSKTKKKKEKLKRKKADRKIKAGKCKSKRKTKRVFSDYSNNGSQSPVVVSQRRRPSVVLRSSSDDDDSNTLHINTDHYSSSDESEYKPRLRSVVVKSVKQEPRTVSPEYTSCSTKSDDYKNSNNSDFYSSYDKDVPGSINTCWSDPYKPSCSHYHRSFTPLSSSSSSSSFERPSKKCKHSKKRLKREVLN